MLNAYDLSQLDPNTFQHMVNALALKVLGNGSTGFGPGADGGRDGYYEGEAPYPSIVEHWSGRWFIQSKYHAPHLSIDSQKWLVKEIKDELAAFENPSSRRNWPDIWIIASNIVPSAVPDTGTYDLANELVGKANAKLRTRFHIWGGDKIVELLNQHQDVARRYGHFLTPGHVLTSLMEELQDNRASAETIIRHLVVSAIEEQQHTKLEQAGSEEDKRPGVHELFVDLPFSAKEHQTNGMVAKFLALAMAQNHHIDHEAGQSPNWVKWRKHPSRASVWFLKGGPGQGKSTVGQFFCQIQRAALILDQGHKYRVPPGIRLLASQIQTAAQERALWPKTARIPIYIELKQYAQWYGEHKIYEPKGMLTYLASLLTREVEQAVLVGTLRRALAARSWFLVFDGLDEVPGDIKDEVAKEVHTFLREAAMNSDLFSLCTSRPQGYSGQFSSIDGPEVILSPLDETQAMKCAELLLHADRPKPEAIEACSILANAIKFPAVKELMTTPLQSHIMAIIVRSGQHPPEKKWELYRRFYDVIRTREANRSPAEKKLFALLTKDKDLLKDVHNRLGFVLHAHAETVKGAQSSLPRKEFQGIVAQAVHAKKDGDVAESVGTIMTAATDRLVLITTPDDGRFVRFQIRQLQEFFAAEFLCDGVSPDELRTRLTLIAGDSHWQEVVHFLMSALVSSNRRTDLSVASSVLQELDEGSEDGTDRTLCRRFARGASMIARLMEDGVLDSDKALRNLLKERLRPLIALRDIISLSPLIRTHGSASKAWLREFLFRGLEEGTTIESMGAAIVLVATLQDSDIEELDRLRRYWVRLDNHQKLYIFNVTDGIQENIPFWKISYLFDYLAERGAYNEFLFMLDDDSDFILKMANIIKEKLGSEAAELFTLFTVSAEVYNLEEYSWVKIYQKNSAIVPKSSMLALCEKVKNVEYTGFFELLRCALLYGCSHEATDMVKFIFSLTDNWGMMNLLPDCIRELLPYDPAYPTPSAMMQAIRAMSTEELAVSAKIPDGRLWIHAPANRIQYSVSLSETVDEARKEFFRLLEKYPEIALRVWGYRREMAQGDFFENTKIIEMIICIIKTQPQYRRIISFKQWNFLILNYPHHSPCLRSLLVELYKDDMLSFWGAAESIDDWKFFELILPTEHDLLRPLCSAIVGMYAGISSGYYHPDQDKTEDLQKYIISLCPKLVRQCVPNLQALEAVIEEDSTSIETRSAAVLMSVIHPEGSIEFAMKHQRLLIAASQRGSAVGIGMAICCEMIGVERRATVMAHLSNLLDATRLYESENSSSNALFVSRQWDAIFRQWRERSHAPVTSSGQIEAWLASAEVS